MSIGLKSHEEAQSDDEKKLFLSDLAYATRFSSLCEAEIMRRQIP